MRCLTHGFTTGSAPDVNDFGLAAVLRPSRSTDRAGGVDSEFVGDAEGRRIRLSGQAAPQEGGDQGAQARAETLKRMIVEERESYRVALAAAQAG
jgi:hypothetical protein